MDEENDVAVVLTILSDDGSRKQGKIPHRRCRVPIKGKPHQDNEIDVGPDGIFLKHISIARAQGYLSHVPGKSYVTYVDTSSLGAMKDGELIGETHGSRRTKLRMGDTLTMGKRDDEHLDMYKISFEFNQ